LAHNEPSVTHIKMKESFILKVRPHNVNLGSHLSSENVRDHRTHKKTKNEYIEVRIYLHSLFSRRYRTRSLRMFETIARRKIKSNTD
jgi:hypothetical protein